MIPCIILARGGSVGIPGKNIIPFCGKPLIVWSIEQALRSGLKVYVSTDDKKIAKVSKKAGANIIDRPSKLATNTVNSDLALLHAVKSIKGKFDCVVNIQCTSPLRYSYDILLSLIRFDLYNYDSLFSCSELNDACIWNDKKSITYDYKKRQNRQDKKPLYLENGSIYIFKKDGFLKHKNRLFGKIGKYMIETCQSHELDEYEDIEICEYYMKRKII